MIKNQPKKHSPKSAPLTHGRDPDPNTKPEAKKWRANHRESTKNLDRILEFLYSRYVGGYHGYINRARTVEYRFASTSDDPLIYQLKIYGRQQHIRLQFELRAPYRVPKRFEVEMLKDAEGQPSIQVVHFNITPLDPLEELSQFLELTNTFPSEKQRKASSKTLHSDENNNSYNPSSEQEGRELIERQVTKRQDQPQFRQKLIKHYQQMCPISGCVIVDVLQAAHITPYNGKSTNQIGNGILLRADLHTLWDRGLLAIDPETFKVWIEPKSRSGDYKKLQNKQLSKNLFSQAKAALKKHWEETKRAIKEDS